MEEVNSEAHRRKIKLQILPTAEAIKILEKDPERSEHLPVEAPNVAHPCATH